MTESHRAIESCDCEACLDAKSLARMLTAAQKERDTLKAAIEPVLEAFNAYKAEERRVYGDVIIDHGGRCGAQLNALFGALAACIPPQETEK